MTPVMTLERWMGTLGPDYLGEFIKDGGSSVKFAVCMEGAEPGDVSQRVRKQAESEGFLTAHVSAETVKIHLIEKLLGAISDQIPWDDLTTRVLSSFARDKGWQVPSLDPARGVVEQLDEVNQLGRQQVSLVLQREFGRGILENRLLAKDFRVAMMWLARERMDTSFAHGIASQQITDWLGGRISAISNMRQYQIFTKVNRANARHLLGSLCTWIRGAGYPGLVVTIDGARLISAARSDDGTLNYSIAAVLDAYEVFRQFIDATDELEGFMLVVTMPPDFLGLEVRGRGIGRYPALMGRVYDEVRDKNLANPYSALVRLGTAKELA